MRRLLVRGSPSLLVVVPLVLAFAPAGCGDGREDGDEPLTSASGITITQGDPTGGIDSDGGDGGDDDIVLDVGGGSASQGEGGDVSSCPCQDVLDGIYVLNTDSPPSVWFYDPPANTFSPVGVLGCAAPLGWTANSMAIDRKGYAWVNYYEQASQTGKLFRAPLTDLQSCVEEPYVNPSQSWWLLGMGYSVVSEQSDCDDLFVYKSDRYLEYPDFGPGGAELGRYVEADASIDVVGPTDYPVAELTGTGDGRLFAFAALGPSSAVLVALDKETGAEIEHTDLTGLDITNAFAFAFWGGDVYFFTETAPLSGVSKVTRLDYDGNEGGGLSVYNADAGIHIPGAGVSTCASFVPPG